MTFVHGQRFWARKGDKVRLVTYNGRVPTPISHDNWGKPQAIWCSGWWDATEPENTSKSTFIPIEWLTPYIEENEFGPVSP